MLPQRKVNDRLGKILLEKKIISQDQMKRALDFQKNEGGLLGEILVKLGYANEIDIAQALTVQYGFPYLPLENYEFKEEIAGIIPENVARQYSVVPLDVFGDILTVAMANPLNQRAIEDLEMMTNKRVRIFLSTVSSIFEALNRIYQTEEEPDGV